MNQTTQIKELVLKSGADLCGIASVERFREAPAGFRPTDIYPDCKSVLVFAKRIPSSSLFLENCIPYTLISQLGMQEVDRMTFQISYALEAKGIANVVIPTDDPYEHWEADKLRGQAILSLRHAGFLAGLGVLGKNTLLINEHFGNMIQLGALLVAIALEPDPLATYEGCKPDCSLCLDSCPQNALDGITVDQQLCRPFSNFKNTKGYVVKKCNICRRICPQALGIKLK
jgi:epoxyqueuosine reductase